MNYERDVRFMEFWAMWLIIVILLAVIEFSTVNLVSVWFIASGIVTIFVSLVTDNFFIQFGVFAILGALLMILTKPLLDKTIKEHKEKLNLDRVMGMEGIVTEEIKPNMVGEVKVDGKRWSAIANEVIAVDTIVKINGIDGVKLVVENVEKEATVEEIKKEETPKKATTKKATNTTKKTTTKKTNSTTKKTTSTAKKNSTTTNKSGSNTKKATTKKASEK